MLCIIMSKLHRELIEAEQQRVMLESVGAACHHISQPMTSILTTLQMPHQNLPEDRNEIAQTIEEVLNWVKNAAEVIHKTC